MEKIEVQKWIEFRSDTLGTSPELSSIYSSGLGNGYGKGSSSGRGFEDCSGFGFGSGDGHGDWDCFGYGDGDVYGNGYDSGGGDGDGYGYGDGECNEITVFNNKEVFPIDDISFIIYSIKGDVAKGAILNIDLTLTDIYIVRDGKGNFAHGITIEEARKSLIYNISQQ